MAFGEPRRQGRREHGRRGPSVTQNGHTDTAEHRGTPRARLQLKSQPAAAYLIQCPNLDHRMSLIAGSARSLICPSQSVVVGPSPGR